MDYEVKKGNYRGTISIPPSKSDSQRALLIAALGDGTSILRNVGKSEDELAMIQNIQLLGASISWLDDKTLSIKGNFQNTHFSTLNCGESGLGLRLLTSIACLKEDYISLFGSGTLLQRDQSFFTTFLPKMGIKVSDNNGKLPLSIRGPLKSGAYTVDGSVSSQYISGLLIAFSQTQGKTELKVENCTSKPYIDMTVHTLKNFGVVIHEKTGELYHIEGKQPIIETDYIIDGDWSAASYWLVASALGLNVFVKGLSLNSKQADTLILEALIAANCTINHSENGLKIEGKNRIPLDFDATNCPDLFPALVSYAALTNGVSKIKGVHRLVNKESNRAEALVEEYKKLGISIYIENDTLFITGEINTIPTTVFSHNDHRIAMSLAITSIVSGVEHKITASESVKKSYPDFWNDLESLCN